MVTPLHRETRKPIVIDATDPRGIGVCDGCSFWVPHHTLRKHMQYRGGSVPVWDGLMVCGTCYDVPNPAPQFKRLVLPPDPVPFENPRPETPLPTYSGYAYWVLEDGTYINTLDSTLTWGGEYVQTTPDTSPGWYP